MKRDVAFLESWIIEFTNDVEKLFSKIGIDFENVFLLGIGERTDVRFDGNEAIETFFFGRLAIFLMIEDAIIDEVLEDVVKASLIDVDALGFDVVPRLFVVARGKIIGDEFARSFLQRDVARTAQINADASGRLAT